MPQDWPHFRWTYHPEAIVPHYQIEPTSELARCVCLQGLALLVPRSPDSEAAVQAITALMNLVVKREARGDSTGSSTRAPGPPRRRR